MKGITITFILLLLSVHIIGQTRDSLSLAQEEERYATARIKPQQIIVPAAMITVGAMAVSNKRLCNLKMDVRNGMQDARGSHKKANVEIWAALSAQLAVVALGPRPKHSFTDRMLVKATSYTLLYATMPVVRRCVREPRPDGKGQHSFPSFKTANAFMAAEQIRIERGWGWGMGMYAFATGIGALQLYNDRCYINDVVAGASMGILTTHVAYWLLPLERRWFGLDKKKKSNKDAALMFLPTYDHSTQTVGMAFTAQL